MECKNALPLPYTFKSVLSALHIQLIQSSILFRIVTISSPTLVSNLVSHFHSHPLHMDELFYLLQLWQELNSIHIEHQYFHHHHHHQSMLHIPPGWTCSWVGWNWWISFLFCLTMSWFRWIIIVGVICLQHHLWIQPINTKIGLRWLLYISISSTNEAAKSNNSRQCWECFGWRRWLSWDRWLEWTISHIF